MIFLLTTSSPPTTPKKIKCWGWQAHTHIIIQFYGSLKSAWYLSEISAFEQTQHTQETHPEERAKKGINKAFSSAERGIEAVLREGSTEETASQIS